MEHYRSTLAVTAIAISGLLCASLLFQTGPFGDHSQQPGTAVASTGTGSGWTDPPRSPLGNVATSELETGAQPSLTMLPPPEVPKPIGVSTPRPEQPRKTVEAHRRKIAQRSARPRLNAPERGPIVQAAAVGQPAPASQKGNEKGIDLIGDLIRGLGIGRDQQG